MVGKLTRRCDGRIVQWLHEVRREDRCQCINGHLCVVLPRNVLKQQQQEAARHTNKSPHSMQPHCTQPTKTAQKQAEMSVRACVHVCCGAGSFLSSPPDSRRLHGPSCLLPFLLSRNGRTSMCEGARRVAADRASVLRSAGPQGPVLGHHQSIKMRMLRNTQPNTHTHSHTQTHTHTATLKHTHTHTQRYSHTERYTQPCVFSKRRSMGGGTNRYFERVHKCLIELECEQGFGQLAQEKFEEPGLVVDGAGHAATSINLSLHSAVQEAPLSWGGGDQAESRFALWVPSFN